MLSARFIVIGSALSTMVGACTSEGEPTSAASTGSVAASDTPPTEGPVSSPGGVTPVPNVPNPGGPAMASGTANPSLPTAPVNTTPTAPMTPMGTAVGVGGSGPGTAGSDAGGSGNGEARAGASGNGEAGTSAGGNGEAGAGGDGHGEAGAGAGSNSEAGASGSGEAGAGGGSNGEAGAGGASSSGALPFGNPPVLSAGCGEGTMVTSGKHTITSSGEDRTYIIDIPEDYNLDTPYRLFYTSHWIGSTSEAVRDQNYYFLKPLAEAANEPAIFVAPQSDGSTWQEKDHALFDDLLGYVKENLCIDTTRVFATGFSFGGMITYSLSVNHQQDIRAAVGIAPANYNIFVPPKTNEPIAWMQTTGMGDGTCPWINGNSTTQGAKFIATEHATDNGCTVPEDIPTWQQGDHLCYDFEGCQAEYPTKVCTFDGGHTNIDSDSGSNENWIAQESWDFFTQF